jgi:hypothetical protein
VLLVLEEVLDESPLVEVLLVEGASVRDERGT